jgi:hypothetical protein
MAQEAIDSTYLAALNTQPIAQVTSGEAGPDEIRWVDDYVTPTSSGMGTQYSVYRLCRFPTYAKVKQLVIDLGILDTGAAGAVFDINVAFSDSLYDGTNQAYTANNGLTAYTATCIPKTGQSGTVTSVTSYTNPNKLFGSITVGNDAVKNNTDVTFNGSYAAGGVGDGPNVAWSYAGTLFPMYEFFGFTDSQGYPADPGGFFDILMVLSTIATTPATAQIHGRLAYAV